MMGGAPPLDLGPQQNPRQQRGLGLVQDERDDPLGLPLESQKATSQSVALATLYQRNLRTPQDRIDILASQIPSIGEVLELRWGLQQALDIRYSLLAIRYSLWSSSP